MSGETDDLILKSEWNAAIEAAAKVIEKWGLDRANAVKDYPAATASACAYHVRALKR
jgi:hypothetical protein